MESKNQLIDKVLKEIVNDVEFGDLTAIEEMLSHLDEDILKAYLPYEDNLKES